MFKDDQMIPMLTGVVVMVAVGLMIQRSDVILSWFMNEQAEEIPLTLEADVVRTKQGRLARIDVLANDLGLQELDATRLIVVSQPVCGNVFVQSGVLQYAPNADCTRFQTITYGLSDDPEQKVGLVQVEIEGAPLPVPGATPEPSTPVEVPVASAPAEVEEQVAVAPAQPQPVPVQPQPAPAPVFATPAEPQAPAPVPADIAILEPTAPEAPGGLQANTSSGGDTSGIVSAPRQPELEDIVVGVIEDGLAEPEEISTREQIARLVGVPMPRRRGQSGDIARFEATDTLSGADTGGDLASNVAGGTAETDASPSVGAIAELEPAEGSVAVARYELSEPLAATPGGLASVQLTDQGVDGVDTMERTDVARSRIATLEASGLDADPAKRPELIGQVAPAVAPQTQGLTAPAATDRPADVSGEVFARVQPGGIASSIVVDPGFRGTEAVSAPQPEELKEDTAPLAPPAAPAEPEVDVAALTPPAAECVIPPSVTIDIQTFARTGIEISSPCHPNSSLSITYSGLEIGAATDGRGAASVMVLGFEASSAASLSFPDGISTDFDIPFSNSEDVMRVALAWDEPVALNLHAREFGAAAFSEGDINTGNPGSFNKVRRRGGGYVTAFAPVNGMGQFIQIYSHLLRRRGESGIVELEIDFTSRDRDRVAQTCSGGPLARPAFTVVKSEKGKMKRPFNGLLAEIECADIPRERTLLTVNSIGSLVISP